MYPPLLPAQEPFHGSIEVRRILSQVRVVDTSGAPIPDLGVESFDVWINGEAVPVEAVEWIPTSRAGRALSQPRRPSASQPGSRTPSRDAEGRLVVIVFQTDFHRTRLTGLYRMSYHAAEFLRGLEPADRVALAVYGSHLQLHVDFTDDFDGLRRLLTVPSLVQTRTASAEAEEPSLARHLDLESARGAATFSQGLRVLGEALEQLPGHKEVVLFAWGLGRYTGDAVWLGQDYNEARLALARARATVYSLDVSTADYHDLEVGLRRVSQDTGGFYVKTHVFPTQALDRLNLALAGYYELTLVAPTEVGEYYTLEVNVECDGCTVLARPMQARRDGG